MDNHPVVIADALGVIRYWSAGAQGAFGYSASDAVNRSLDLIIPPDFRQAHWNGFRRAMTSGSSKFDGQSQEFPVQRSDGAVESFPGTVTLLRSKRGVVGVMVIFEAETRSDRERAN